MNFNVRALRSFSNARRDFQLWNEAQKERLIFVPKPIVEVPGGVSRVEMNAKNGALDTPPDTTGVCCAKQLTGADAVIHGATILGGL